MESPENFFKKVADFLPFLTFYFYIKSLKHYSTMNFITVIKNLIPKKIQRPVGRWRLENCKSSMNQKIDLSNEDHCGPCGQYALEKRDVLKDKLTVSTSVTNHKKL